MKLACVAVALAMSLAPCIARAQATTVFGKSETSGISVTGIGFVPAEFDRHVLRVDVMVDVPGVAGRDTPGTIKERAEKALASRAKSMAAALAPFGIKPGVATGTYVLPDGPCDGSMFGTATKAQLLAAIRKVSPESSPTLESSASPALLKRLQKACLVEALKNAREQAETIAELLDVKLGKVTRASSGQMAYSNTLQRSAPIAEGPTFVPNPTQFQTYILVSYEFEHAPK